MIPRVSVVVPTYNRAEMLCTVLPSYLASPLVSEVIVVDDAGHDDTAARLKPLLRSEPRLYYLRNEGNLGAPATRNRGFSVAAGDWVLQGEDDLALMPGTIECLLEHALAKKADIIAGRRIWMRIGEDVGTALARADRYRGNPFDELLLDVHSHAKAAEDIELPLLDATMLIRRAVFERVLYHTPYAGQSTWREESDFQISALELGFRLVFCPHAATLHFSRASQSFGRNRLKSTGVYAYRVYRNNLQFLRRHAPYLRTHYPRSILFGRPEVNAVIYGVYRTSWLLAVEALRWWRARTKEVMQWQ